MSGWTRTSRSWATGWMLRKREEGTGTRQRARASAVEDLSEKAQNAMRAGFSDVATDIHRVESSLRASIASTRSESGAGTRKRLLEGLAPVRGPRAVFPGHGVRARDGRRRDEVRARRCEERGGRSVRRVGRGDDWQDGKVKTEVDENIKDLMEGQGTLEDALLEKLKA